MAVCSVTTPLISGIGTDESRHNVILIDKYLWRGRNFEGTSPADMGGRIELLEIHSKMNIIYLDTIEVIFVAIDHLDADFDGLVIYNQVAHVELAAIAVRYSVRERGKIQNSGMRANLGY
jgi:hypothetical protein